MKPEHVARVAKLLRRYDLIKAEEPSLTHDEYLHRLEWLLDHPVPLPPPSGPVLYLG
jgi:hypothetical protein